MDEPTTQWQLSDFEELHRAVGLSGPQDVAIIAGKPPIRLDLSGVAVLTALGKWGNPVLRERAKQLQTAAQHLQAATPAADEAEAETAPVWSDAQDAALAEAIQANTEYFDAVLAAVVLRPPYQTIDSLRRDGPRPGHLTVFMFSQDERTAVQELITGGAAALARFRADPTGFIAGPARAGVAPEPRAGAVADPAGASGVLAERGAVAARGRVGARAAGAGRAGRRGAAPRGAANPHPPTARAARGAA